MVDNVDYRGAERTDHITPLQVKDLRSGDIYEARMFNYSDGGIYFESDGFFEKGTPLYLGILNSPYHLISRVFEYYKGEVMWRKDLKRSLFSFGYGIQLISEASKQDMDSNDPKKAKDSRKHPRKPFSQTIRFGTHKGISEGDTKNISASGVFIATNEKLEVGQLLKLNLPLKKGKMVRAEGQIMWINDEGFGLKFIEIKNEKT